MKVLLAAVLALALPAIADETKLGAGVTLKEATPISALAANPQDFVGKTIRVDGVATEICEMMGCWMAIASAADQKSPLLRVQVDHDGKIKFPVSARGKSVSAEGVFEALKEAPDEGPADPDNPLVRFQIKGTGAVIR